MASKTLSRAILPGAVPPVLAAYAILVHRTTRWCRLGDEHFQALIASGEPFICALWHARLLLLPFTVAEMGRPVTAIASDHRDGEVATRFMETFGIDIVRGSTGDPRKPETNKHGARALKQMVAAARAGANTAITPDGPRGPRQCAQSGVAQLARLTGLPVLPMTYATSRGRRLGTWDGFVLPYPGGRGVFAFGAPIRVRGKDLVAIEEGRAAIEVALNALTDEADRAMGTGDGRHHPWAGTTS